MLSLNKSTIISIYIHTEYHNNITPIFTNVIFVNILLKNHMILKYK